MDIDPLTELTIQLSKSYRDNNDRFRWICQSIARVLPQVNRVSLWRLNDNFTAIHCVFLLADGQSEDVRELTLYREDNPEYFEAVLRYDTVNASDARHHPDTQGFTESYFRPNNIYSLLDYIFHRDFTPFGVICCEATQQPVSWQERDVALLKRVAGIVSMFY